MVVIRDNAASATWLLENWCLVFWGNYLCYNFASNFFCGELTKNFQSVFAAVHFMQRANTLSNPSPKFTTLLEINL